MNFTDFLRICGLSNEAVVMFALDIRIVFGWYHRLVKILHSFDDSVLKLSKYDHKRLHSVKIYRSRIYSDTFRFGIIFPVAI